MNTQLLTIQRATTARRPQRGSRRVHAPAGSASVALRPATPDDALAIHALIEAHLAEGRLLPRSLAELTVALGIGKRLIAELQRAASRGGFDRLCAFTHDAGYFVRKGFSIVPHHWVPEKIARDCTGCAQFRTCGQHAVLLPLKG